jgi:hypothetical protein
MASAKSSLIWDHFREVGDIVSCNQCPKTYKLATAKSSTQPLWYHLKTKHGVLPRKRSLNDRDGALPPVVKKQRTITTYIEKKTQQQMYAELAASDRFSFGQIANSDFIRDAMRKNQFHAHISPHTVRKKVFEFYVIIYVFDLNVLFVPHTYESKTKIKFSRTTTFSRYKTKLAAANNK